MFETRLLRHTESDMTVWAKRHARVCVLILVSKCLPVVELRGSSREVVCYIPWCVCVCGR